MSLVRDGEEMQLDKGEHTFEASADGEPYFRSFR